MNYADPTGKEITSFGEPWWKRLWGKLRDDWIPDPPQLIEKIWKPISNLLTQLKIK